MLVLTASTVGLLVYVYAIGWVLTWVELVTARLPGEVVSSAFDARQLLGIGLRTVLIMGLVFAGACLVSYLFAARNWAANGPDWHTLICARGVRAVHERFADPARLTAWEARRQRELARAQALRAERVHVLAARAHLEGLAARADSRRGAAQEIVEAGNPAAAAQSHRLKRRAGRLRAGLLRGSRRTSRAGRLEREAAQRANEATHHVRAEQPPVAPLGDRAVRVVAGFNMLLIATVFGLSAGRLADVIPGASGLALLVAALVTFAVWSALSHWGPLLARPSAHVIAWTLVGAAAVLVVAPLGLLLIGSIAVSTFGRVLARRAPPTSLTEFIRSPFPWVLLSFYTLVGLAYYATPPVSFQTAVVTSADGVRVGGYISRTSTGVYLAKCVSLADATSTAERAELIPSDRVLSVRLGGPETSLDSGERPSLLSLGLNALGADAHVGALIRAELRGRRPTCAGAAAPTLTAAAADPALGPGAIVGTGPPTARAHDGERPIQATSPPPIARLARLYQPTIEVSVADRFWPVSVGAVLRDVGRYGEAACVVRFPGRGCKPLRRLGELTPQGSGPRDFLRLPAPRASDPSNQFRAFLNGQYVFPGSDHRWLADPGLLHPWYTAQVYFYYAGPLTNRETWPSNARNPNVEPGLVGLEYWFFYPYNYYPTIINSGLMEQAPIAGDELNTDLHQGDWEHITVLVDPHTFTPRWLYMARHADEGSFLPWDSPTLSFDGTHPIVQAAFGGHPTYDNHCGGRPRGRVYYLSSDWVVCGSGRFAFRAATTPLVDLAQTSWGCWQGRFGEATKWPGGLNVAEESDNVVEKGLQLVYAPGPRSPLWQAENAKLLGGRDICSGDPRKPEEEAAPNVRRALQP